MADFEKRESVSDGPTKMAPMPSSLAPPSLPEPSIEAAATSRRLAARIGEAIEAAGGWIPFSRFMELALYAPGLGYYSAGAVKVGRSPGDGSDFATAPEISPLFAQAIARPIGALLEADSTVLELGGGSGALAVELLLALERLDRLPAKYSILEVSGDLRDRQRARLAERAPQLAGRVTWLDALPPSIDGVIVGNEVLDALPVDCVVKGNDGWLERGVGIGADGFAFEDRAADQTLARTIESSVPDADALPVGYVTELHRAQSALVRTLAERMSARSAMLLFDYGFPASEYYHPQRSDGTLIGHYRHRTAVDLLARPGLQDLTAHVDFSAVARAAIDAGCAVVGYTSQASFLLDCGILDAIPAAPDDALAYARHAVALQKLLSESEMGELFKVIALAPKVRDIAGFGLSDRRSALAR